MKKTVSIGLFALLFLLPCSSYAAAHQPPRTLVELISLGLKTNLNLRVQLADVAQSRQATIIQQALFDPVFFADTRYEISDTAYESAYSSAIDSQADTISGQAGFSRLFNTGLNAQLSLNSYRQENEDLSLDLDPHQRSSLRLDLNQPLLRGCGRKVNTTALTIAGNDERRQALAYLLQAQQLVLQLETAIWNLAAGAETTALRIKAEHLADQLYQDNQRRYRLGVIPITELQEAQTAKAERRLKLSLAQQNYDLLLEDLNRQLNFALPTTTDPAHLVQLGQTANQTDELDLEAEFTAAENKRLEFKISGFAMENSRLRENYQLNQLKPQLDLRLTAALSGLSGTDRGQRSGTAYAGNWLDSFAGLARSDGFDWAAGLSFSLPLGQREAKAQLQQTRLQLRQEQWRRQDLEAAIRLELKAQLISLQRSREQLGIAQQFVQLAQTALAQEQRRLEEGLSDSFRLITFQNKLIDAEIGKVEALTNVHIAQARMDYYRGNIFQRHGIVLTLEAEELSLEDL